MTRVPRCACGCGTSLAGLRSGAKWASGACSKRWLRANPGRRLSDARIPDVAPTRPGGITVSYQKAVRAVAAFIRPLDLEPFATAEECAAVVLASALSPSARIRLEAKA